MKKLYIDEIKQIENSILIKFADFCKKNNLTYFLCGGTLLGAIRHKGFIPWDDDIDVFMPRKDFERFIELTGENPIDEVIDTCYFKNTKVLINYPFVKLINNKTKVIEKTKSEENYMGIWIDVFPIDGFSNSNFINKIYCFYKSFWKKLCFTYSDDLTKVTNIKKKIGKTLVMPFLKVLGAKKLFNLYDSICKKFDFEKCNKVGCTIWGYGRKEIIYKSDLFPSSKVIFESKEFSAPNNPDAYLHSLYGDYMKLPPVEKRVNHEMEAFWID